MEDGIPVELFKILEDDTALNMPANLENSAVATELEKIGQFSFQFQGKAMSKNLQTTAQLHSSHMLAK